MLLEVWRDGDGLAGQQGRDPFGGPGAFARIVDPSQRLQSDRCIVFTCKCAPEIMPVAAHGEGGCADRPAKVEGEDLRIWIAPELQRHQRQQHALAGTGGAYDQRGTDVADMQREAEGRRAFRPGKEKRRTVGTGSRDSMEQGNVGQPALKPACLPRPPVALATDRRKKSSIIEFSP